MSHDVSYGVMVKNGGRGGWVWGKFPRNFRGLYLRYPGSGKIPGNPDRFGEGPSVQKNEILTRRHDN